MSKLILSTRNKKLKLEFLGHENLLCFAMVFLDPGEKIDILQKVCATQGLTSFG